MHLLWQIHNITEQILIQFLQFLYLHACKQGSPDKFPVAKNVAEIWLSLACLQCKRPKSGKILTGMNLNWPG